VCVCVCVCVCVQTPQGFEPEHHVVHLRGGLYAR
jgi:hypothetical protein